MKPWIVSCVKVMVAFFAVKMCCVLNTSEVAPKHFVLCIIIKVFL